MYNYYSVLLNSFPSCSIYDRLTNIVLCLFCFQLEVVVYDDAYTADRATSTVTINVNRNPSGPVFIDNLVPPLTYTRLITENFPVGDVVIDVNATDSDGVSLNLYC